MKLKFPFTVDSVKYDELTPRRLKGADMLTLEKMQGLGNSEAQTTLSMIALLCDVPENVPEQMDAEDIYALGEIIGNFIPKTATKEAKRPV